ncbi:DNA cytosine methyltransferase [bacterium]|nr:DNA cytosine methyltransferase [bacterium]
MESSETPTSVEGYVRTAGAVERRVLLRSGELHGTRIADRSSDSDAFAAYWKSWLFGPRPEDAGSRVTVADLFAGCGGLSVGVDEAARAVGKSAESVLAVDTNGPAMDVYEENFRPTRAHRGDIAELIDRDLGDPLSRLEKALRSQHEGLTLAVGGPPCQGHSDLNNHTRRSDPKNALYAKMGRFVEVARPEHVIIENVPGVLHDRTRVVQRTSERLSAIGYTVTHGVLAADELGWPQRRKRHVLIASRTHSDLNIDQLFDAQRRDPLPVGWILGDKATGESLFNSPARHAAQNKRRIDFLFNNDIYELPDSERPDCHRLKPHSYKSVYGRMRNDQPAPTITSGFGSTGQGRFVHPLQRRTLTPREASHLQGFPDWFSFESANTRGALQEMIGNAVPSRLAYVVALELLR